ncbi:MAG: serpin family protein [Chitinispirillaceae bacterium]|nr:serpin family protein [Chitinispirillaceae bacterium]
MKQRLFLCMALSVFCSSASCSREQSLSRDLAVDERHIEETFASVNDFGLELFKRLSSGTENVFLSPYSVFTALGIACAGAQGATAREMKKVLRIRHKGDAFHARMKKAQEYLQTLEKDQGFQLKSANALWADQRYPFLKSYVDRMHLHYAARITNLDFINRSGQAINTINKWVEEKTGHKIKDLLQTLPDGAKLVITNAVYFKADWEHAFSKDRTREEPFYPAPDKKVIVPMMTKTIDDLYYYENSRVQLVRIPYKKGAIEMAVLLPKKGIRLKRIENMLNAQTMQSLLDSASTQEVELSLPRFKMEFGCSLVTTLMAMGMNMPFSPDADFSLMDGTKKLSIGQVRHKAFVEVDEKGTEAAAATAVTMVYASARTEQSPKIFKADRPFLFVIRDAALGCFLFLGRVGNPLDG